MSRPRALHPLAWWGWAGGLGIAASRTTNPLLLGLIIAVVGYVVAARRPAGGWASGFRSYLVLALVVVAIRTGFHVVFGGGSGETVLVRLPEVGLPDWAAGVRLGGAVTAEGLAAALYDGLRLATLLICVGAAVTLADPRQLLRALPGALYALGLVVVVAVSVAPQLVEAALRVRRARALRGGSGKGLRALRSVAMPVLAIALERAISLAAAMDGRGYGRTGAVTGAARRLTAALLLLGLLGSALGVYGLLDTSVPGALGWPTLLFGALASVAGLVAGGARGTRSRFHAAGADRRSMVVATCGLIAGVTMVVASLTTTAVVITSAYPLTAPALAVLPVAGVLIALLPAVVAPAPGRTGVVGAARPRAAVRT